MDSNTLETIRQRAAQAVAHHFEIDPCPSYFDCGDDQAYGLYAADENGVQGDCLVVVDGPAATWELWKISTELFGYAVRGGCWKYV